jgi:hypothetical protein
MNYLPQPKKYENLITDAGKPYHSVWTKHVEPRNGKYTMNK